MTMKQFKEKYEKRKRVKGVSMVSLVITIIVILILTAIVFVGSMKTIDEADYSKYVSNVSDVSTAFREASTAVNGDKTAEGNQKNEEQVYNYVANAGNKEEDFLVPNEIPRYTIIKDDARIGIKLPEMKVESGTGKRVIAQYATTKKGVIFTWPPYNYGDELHITDKDTVEHKMQTTITVGDETFEIELDPIDGTLKDLPVIPVQPGGGGNEDNIDPDEPEEPVVPPHEHVFSSQTVTHEYLCSAATCTSAATYYYKCIGCAEKGTSTYTSGNALGHDYSSKNTSSTYLKSQATCTSPAEYYYKCVSCTQKGTETYTHGAKGNHSFGGYTTEKEANCSETGSQKRTCTKCNTIETAVIPKDASKHANIVETVLTEASCTTAGLKKVYCDSCDTVINEETIASKGHNFVGVTCTTGGTCSNCGATTVALGHDWNSATPRVCKRCGEIGEIAVVPKDGVYYVGVTSLEIGEFDTATAIYVEGEELPPVSDGDIYVYGGYEYRYNRSGGLIDYGGAAGHGWEIKENQDGWGVIYIDDSDTPGTIKEEINGKKIVSLASTFWANGNIVDASNLLIPETVLDMDACFCWSDSLKYAPAIPKNVTNLDNAFNGCSSLINPPDMTNAINVTSMYWTFYSCSILTGEMEINANPTRYSSCFAYTSKDIYLTGSSTMLEEIASTDGYTDFSKKDNVRVLTTFTIVEEETDYGGVDFQTRTYQVPKGMNWGEWCGSKYNKDKFLSDIGFEVSNDGIYAFPNEENSTTSWTLCYVYKDKNNKVLATDVIEEGKEYLLHITGEGISDDWP